jgi:hypothetical protein
VLIDYYHFFLPEIRMNTNPWLVDSIKAFSFLNCPECVFQTKEDNLFGYHAAKNHPLSTAFFDKQTELEQSLIGLKTVEYSPDLDSKLEKVPTTNESNDPLECTTTNFNEILGKPITCQHCEEKVDSISKFQTHCKECLYNGLEDFDENIDNDYENVNSRTDEAHEDFDESLADDDNWLLTIGNSGINDELSQSAIKPGICKNPISGKNLTDIKQEFELESQTKMTRQRRKFPEQIGDAMFKDSNLKKFLAENKLPREKDFNSFLKAQPPLPEGYTWKDLKSKFNCKIQNLKKRAANAQAKEQKRKEKTEKRKKK